MEAETPRPPTSETGFDTSRHRLVNLRSSLPSLCFA